MHKRFEFTEIFLWQDIDSSDAGPAPTGLRPLSPIAQWNPAQQRLSCGATPDGSLGFQLEVGKFNSVEAAEWQQVLNPDAASVVTPRL